MKTLSLFAVSAFFIYTLLTKGLIPFIFLAFVVFIILKAFK